MIPALCLILLCGTTNSNVTPVSEEPFIEIVRSNGGPYGFNNVNEYHDSGATSVLRCENPGYADGNWTSLPDEFETAHGSMLGLVEETARSGEAEGIELYRADGRQYRVEWRVSSAGDTVIRAFEGWLRWKLRGRPSID